MPTFQTYHVTPTLPGALEPLREMSFNLWWTWEPSARRLFRHLDPELWNRTNHNPVRMLQLSRQLRLEEVSQDKAFLRELKEVHDAFRNYLARKDTYGKTGAGSAIKNPVAYFSAEFGFHETLPIAAGGLGILVWRALRNQRNAAQGVFSINDFLTVSIIAFLVHNLVDIVTVNSFDMLFATLLATVTFSKTMAATTLKI